MWTKVGEGSKNESGAPWINVDASVPMTCRHATDMSCYVIQALFDIQAWKAEMRSLCVAWTLECTADQCMTDTISGPHASCTVCAATISSHALIALTGLQRRWSERNNSLFFTQYCYHQFESLISALLTSLILNYWYWLPDIANLRTLLSIMRNADTLPPPRRLWFLPLSVSLLLRWLKKISTNV